MARVCAAAGGGVKRGGPGRPGPRALGAIERYTNEARRLYGVMNRQIARSRYVAGPEYSIADMAIFPWTRSHANQGIDLADYPNVRRWYDAIEARPAMQRGVKVPTDRRKPQMSDKDKETLFGSKQYAKR